MSWRDRIAQALAGGAETLYHGTSKDKGFKQLRDTRNGTWFSTNPKEASQYAVENDSMGMRWLPGGGLERVNQAPRVVPMTHQFENTATLQEWPEAIRNASNYKRAQGDYFDTLRAQGFDSVRMPSDDGHSIFVSFDNSKLIPKYSQGIKGSLYGAGAAVPIGASVVQDQYGAAP